jgi:hypothetical protein
MDQTVDQEREGSTAQGYFAYSSKVIQISNIYASTVKIGGQI